MGASTARPSSSRSSLRTSSARRARRRAGVAWAARRACSGRPPRAATSDPPALPNSALGESAAGGSLAHNTCPPFLFGGWLSSPLAASQHTSALAFPADWYRRSPSGGVARIGAGVQQDWLDVERRAGDGAG